MGLTKQRKGEILIKAFEDANFPKEVLLDYLKEKVKEDRSLNDVKKSIIQKADYYERKAALAQIELLILLIDNKP